MFVDNLATVIDALHDPKLLKMDKFDKSDKELMQSLTIKRLLSDIFTCQITPPHFMNLLKNYDKGYSAKTPAVYCSITGG